MKKSLVAILCLAAVLISVNAQAAGDRAATHARHSRAQSSGSFKGEMKTMFKSIGHGLKRGGHAIGSFARHTGRRVKAGVRAAKRQR